MYRRTWCRSFFILGTSPPRLQAPLAGRLDAPFDAWRISFCCSAPEPAASQVFQEGSYFYVCESNPQG